MKLATGTVLVDESAPGPGGVALYARVSCSDQRGDLERQLARLVEVATSIGSGLNGSRSKLKALLRDPAVGVIVVEHRDRLARFGVEYVEAALAASGRRLVVVAEAEVADDMVRDMVEVLTSFGARLYGRRSARHRAEKAVHAAADGGEQAA